MCKLITKAVLGLTFACLFHGQAAALPINSEVHVELNDALILAPEFAPDAAVGAGLQAFFGSSNLSSDGVDLVDTFAGPSEFADSTILSFSGISSVTVGGATDGDADFNLLVSPPSPLTDFDPIDVTTSIVNGQGSALGAGIVASPFSTTGNADVAANISNVLSTAVGNTTNNILSLTVADDPFDGADLGADGTFTIQFFLNTVLAFIDLDAGTNALNIAQGEFNVEVEADRDGDDLVGTTFFEFGESIQIDGSDAAVSESFVSFLPSTAGGSLTASPVLEFEVAPGDEIEIEITLTTSAFVVSAIPEPTGLTLAGIAGVCGIGFKRLRRRYGRTAA